MFEDVSILTDLFLDTQCQNSGTIQCTYQDDRTRRNNYRKVILYNGIINKNLYWSDMNHQCYFGHRIAMNCFVDLWAEHYVASTNFGCW